MQRRNTKYSRTVKQVIEKLHHATNAEVHAAMVSGFPDVSATTIHRVTKRLAEDGEIAVAPSMKDGSARYDATTLPHDHFVCGVCERLRDTDIAGRLIPEIEASLDDCKISGRLVVYGTCKDCSKNLT
jgi:Fur family transcriptional regulator, peroxide stress response regulator